MTRSQNNHQTHVAIPPTRGLSLLALCVSLFVAVYAAAPAYAQAVAPTNCANPAEIVDDGNNADMITDEDSVAVGCGSEVGRDVARGDSEPGEVNLLTLQLEERDENDEPIILHLLRVDCDELDYCEDVDGNNVGGTQYSEIGKRLADRLVAVATTPLTESEKADLRTRLEAAVLPLSVIDSASRMDEAVLTDHLTFLNVPVPEGVEEVAGVAVGADANVKANGGVAIGNGATVGADVIRTPNLIWDPELGVFVGAEVTEEGGGGVNGIAIGNGAMAMGEGSIAIGSGAMAAEDGQVIIGTHDIGAMSEDVIGNTAGIAENAAGIAENAAGIAENAMGVATNAMGVADNSTMIGANSMRLDGHDADLAANRNQLNQHAAMLSQHADSIQNNATQIKMLDERVNQVAAMAAALSAVPNAPDRDEKFFLGIGMGSHDGESSVAAGLAGRLGANKNIVINAGVANSGGGTTVRAGIGWSF